MSKPQSADQPKPVSRPMATGLAILASLIRWIPHGWNFTPTYAVEVFAGARMRAWHALALALGFRAITDLGIMLFPFPGQEGTARLFLAMMPWIYVSVIANVFLGRLLKNTESPWMIGGIAVLASVQFYLLSNFGSWLVMPTYEKTVTGLLECYWMGLPWFRPTLIANLVFVPVLFGAHALLARLAFPRERVVVAAA
ncbi:MAG TPA: DUF6580 family putative transport protein [Gemmataceae bacterium]|jgi:hypothetical protein|nr:DUF6580 family putative transport protein [Gemmataceae bacterium]